MLSVHGRKQHRGLLATSQQYVFHYTVKLRRVDKYSEPSNTTLIYKPTNSGNESVQNVLSSILLSKNVKIKIFRVTICLLYCMRVKLGRLS